MEREEITETENESKPTQKKSNFISNFCNVINTGNRLIITIIIVAIVVAIAGVLIGVSAKKKKQNKIELKSISFAVTDVLNTSKLNVAKYPYKGLAEWNEANSDGTTTKIGLIQFEGEYTFNVDFAQIRVGDVGKDNVVPIIVPKISGEATLKEGSITTIFENKTT